MPAAKECLHLRSEELSCRSGRRGGGPQCQGQKWCSLAASDLLSSSLPCSHAVATLVCRFQPIVEASPSLVPDGFIYLQAEPDVCMTRLQHRQRAEESGVSSVVAQW